MPKAGHSLCPNSDRWAALPEKEKSNFQKKRHGTLRPAKEEVEKQKLEAQQRRSAAAAAPSAGPWAGVQFHNLLMGHQTAAAGTPVPMQQPQQQQKQAQGDTQQAQEQQQGQQKYGLLGWILKASG